MTKATAETLPSAAGVAPADPVPPFGPGMVGRPRLMERLLSSRPASVVLLQAPAGYSKTVSLAEWASLDERPFAWVAADARHADPASLVGSIVASLDQIELVDPAVLLALSTPAPNIEGVVLARLGSALAGRDPFVLVVDDVHLIDSEVSLGVLASVVAQLPPGAQLALASRSEPSLPIARWRAERKLVELGQRELALRSGESGELLAGIGLRLAPEQAAQLQDRTEGWPAATYLAGLALGEQEDLEVALDGFAGDDRFVVDYARDELLASLEPERLEFLTRTSILDELSGPLCDAVLERGGSGAVLRELADSNSLVVELDRRDERFRYHHLFADLLAAELRHREPGAERELHRRASAWYAGEGRHEPAVEHALAAADIERAGELIWAAWPLMSGRGQAATVAAWIEAVPDERIAASAPFSLLAAHHAMAMGDGAVAAHWARAAEAADDGGREADLRLLAAQLGERGLTAMRADAQRAHELHPPEAAWQAPALMFRGVAEQLGGDSERAEASLREAARRGAVSSPIIQAVSLAQLALLAVERDDWQQASRLISQARAQVDRCGLGEYPSMTIVLAASALVAAREGRVERAREEAAAAERLLAELEDYFAWYEVECRIVLASALARLGQGERARKLLAEAERALVRIPDAPVLAGWLRDSTAQPAQATGEPANLTPAELRTLQYLPTHLTFPEIARSLQVSPNTVKTQARAVYRKLGAGSRGEAVRLAQRAGLLAERPPRLEA